MEISVPTDKFTDIRQKIWLTICDHTPLMTFITKNDIAEIIPILGNVFEDCDTNGVLNIIIDILDILLTNYKDRAKAYDIVVSKYKF